MSYFLKSIFLLMILVDCKIKPIPLNWSWTKRIFTEKQPYNFTIKRVLKQRVILKNIFFQKQQGSGSTVGLFQDSYQK